MAKQLTRHNLRYSCENSQNYWLIAQTKKLLTSIARYWPKRKKYGEKTRQAPKLSKGLTSRSFRVIIFSINQQRSHLMQRIVTLETRDLNHCAGGCGECQTSCQSACKTSCGVANQPCEQTEE